MKTKKAIVAVSNDLCNDRRVDNTCSALLECGYDVLLVGRRRRGSPAIARRAYKTYRMRMIFQKKVWFYAAFNFRLFFFLLVRRAGLIVANDLDTLAAAWLVSRIRGIKLVYDTHEFFYRDA